ncbi:MAG: YceI family protein [Acidobacteria bacterium]|nr:YceI family protein [Acidobacteriota bacterium]
MTSTTEVQKTIDFPPQGDWALDPDHTVAGFVGRYLMLTKVPGKFNGVSGMIHIANDPEESWMEVSLKTASITTDHDDRDKHLKSPDFLDVGNHPTIEFRSTGFEGAGEHWTVSGDLTIKGETRPITLDVEYHGVVSDPWGGQRIAFSAVTEINREDWGLTWNVALEAGGVLVGPKVRLEIETQGVLQTDSSA